LRLVTSVGTRVARTEAELSVSDSTHNAVTALVKGRLLVVHDGEAGATYELAHEVLVRGWGTLRDWLDADAEERARRERLSEACAEWQRIGRRADATWRGPRLVEAVALDQTNLTVLEREFVAASLRATSSRKLLRNGAIAGVVLLVVAVYVIQRHVAAARLDDAVGAEIAAARVDLETARNARGAQRELSVQAFTVFDAGDGAQGEALWSRTLVQRAQAARTYRSAARGVEAALAKDPTRGDVRDLLGDILLERAELAQVARDDDALDELTGRLAAYDVDGSRRRRASMPGRLVVHTLPGAGVLLDGKLIGTGNVERELPAGSYVVEISALNRAPLRDSVLVERDELVELSLTPPPQVPDGFIYIAPGAFLYGSAADEDTRRIFFSTVPMHRRRTAGFLIARTEVTFGDWLAYVEAQPEAERPKFVPNIPAKLGGGIRLENTPAGWRLTLLPVEHTYSALWGEPIRYEGRKVHAVQDWSKLPVVGISANDALGYTAWLARTGRVRGARLCTELEWERAARGADGRSTPTGHRLEPDDANVFGLSADAELMGPDEVGTHPASVSVYGLFDTAGNAFEWTRGDQPETYVARGGSYYHDGKTADLANRNVSSPVLRDASAGMRVCATPP
jgi:formylglycine-generating enzyme required for sulfatase activity